nr:hypothetical protein [Micromonospora tarapacensis]
MTAARAPRPGGAGARPARSGRSPWSLPVAAVLVLAGVFATGAGLGRTAGGPLEWAAVGGGQPSPGCPPPPRSPGR